MIEIILMICTVLALMIYLYTEYHYLHWEHLKFPVIPAEGLFGNFRSVYDRKMSFGKAVTDLYWQTEEPFIGIYVGHRPAVLVRDVHLVQKILVGDSDSFLDRGIFFDYQFLIPMNSIFSAPSSEWNILREQFKPAFSAKRLDAMFNSISDLANQLEFLIDRVIVKYSSINIRELFLRYTTDAMGLIFYGVLIDSINKNHHLFTKLHDELQCKHLFSSYCPICFILCPR